MLRKIDCVMLRVGDLDAAAHFYENVFGLRRLWSDASSVGLGMPETDAEIVLHTMDLTSDLGVHYLVDDVRTAVAAYEERGLTVREPPFEIEVGWCAVLADRDDNPICVLDLSKGHREASTTTRTDD
ncbi:MAG TPA: VOC family protein [Micromonosporaceae bacterium]|nr:VOC family protein [Micromonosporaceae bacterium]